MNIFQQIGKQAAEVLVPHKKPKSLDWVPTQASKSFINQQEAQTILNAMRAAVKHDALEHTNVHLNRADLTDFGKRVQDNPKLWDIAKWSLRDSPIIDETQSDNPKHWSDSYHPWSGDVYLPSANPAVLMHELGHAADFQEFPHDSYVRGFIGNTYRKFAPTLWTEHAAWRKGKNKFLEGAAKTEVDPELVKRTLRDAAQIKPPALGSYWGPRVGSTIGGGLGLAAALALANSTGRTSIHIPLVGSVIGGALGLGAGSYIGKQIGSREGTHNEKAMNKYFDQYAKAYAKTHDIGLDEAKQKLLSLINKKTTKRKAA